MRRSLACILFPLMMSAAPGALMAQTEEPRGPAGPLDDADEIIVTGQPQRGAVVGNIKPEQQLSPADVRALGVTSIAEMITELSPQTNGSPVILLNGKRISSFSEIQDIPSEAVARVDILPEETALAYGYAPTQKVVNIVLRQRFRAETVDLRAGTTTQGGRDNGTVEGGLLRIRGDNRFTLNMQYKTAASLLESERGVVPTVQGERANRLSGIDAFLVGENAMTGSELAHHRTLSPATESFATNATLSRALGKVSMTINGRLELSDSDSLQGYEAEQLTLAAGNPFSPFADETNFYRYLRQAGVLGQQIKGTTGHVGVTLNGLLGGGWQWSFTGNGDYSNTRTSTDRGFGQDAVQGAINAGADPFGSFSPDLLSTRVIDRAKAESRAVQGDLLLSGSLFDLPAGAVTTAVRLGGSANGFDSRSIRSGVERNGSYNREIGSGQISLDMPITSRSKGVLGAVGDIGVNVNAAAQRYSDFGTLSTLGYGMRWRPVPAVQLLVSANQDRAAPTGTQITDPEIRTPNVSVFDYATGQTVFVTQVSGGNPNLKESVRDQFRLSANIKPFEKPNLTLTATYTNSRTRNPISAFPTPSPAIEDAFPNQFVRSGGVLTEIRTFPVNYLRSQSEQLRWGFDFSIPLKSHIQKVVEAWRAAGAKPEERPKELQDLRGLFGNRGPGGGQPPQGQDGGDRPRREGGQGGQGGGGFGGGGQRGPGGGFGGPGGFGGGGGRGGGGGGRLSFSLYHTWHFTESILIAPGVPKLDLLNGDATGSSGGQPRHELNARVGYTNNGLGARLGVDWESGTHVDGALSGTPGGASRLNFGSLATVDLRLFANLGQMPSLVKRHPFLRGTRVSIGIDNLFNQRREVTDANGMTPVRYQPGYLDPIGRAVTISFRKLFF
ncbi:TonB-dependent receptor [Sphingobium sp. JS3065]|uniref:TonB-dependent receptor n=1 Tax=Sphingobium sp. JS3065 TaxID=2970925 RepID=UPI0022650279|nr:TonB-dependent receptor [Sphingobium sp. JS3065]UZW54209.1 TonB-dependent receptor [Sphingobium sp. JS3065]